MKADLIHFSVRHAGIFLMSNLFEQRLHPILVKTLNITYRCKLKEYLQARGNTNLSFFE
jgi:hypothetical protein